MKHCASIAGRTVCSESEYVLFSNTRGVLGERNDYEQAKRLWDAELARYAERGQSTDTLLFEWSQDHWMMVGSLYDL